MQFRKWGEGEDGLEMCKPAIEMGKAAIEMRKHTLENAQTCERNVKLLFISTVYY